MAHCRAIGLLMMAVFLGGLRCTALGEDLVVDYRYRPPQWRTAICPPDDPYKTLVDEEGVLLYHFNRGGRAFGTHVYVVVDEGAKTTGQNLLSPRVPVVQTRRATPELEILEEVFAIKKAGPKVSQAKFTAARKDGSQVERRWAKPPAGVSAKLSAIAVGAGRPVHYQIKVPSGAAVTVALGLCEGWHSRTGQRVMDLSVEGAPVQQVDTVAKLGRNVAGAFWFDARDENSDGLIDLKVAAAPGAPDQNAILNAFWVFGAKTNRDDKALLAGELDQQAAFVAYAGEVDTDSRNDVILVHVTNKGNSPQTIEPKVIVDSGLDVEVLEPNRVQVDGHETVACTEKVSGLRKRSRNRGQEAVMTLSPLTVQPGGTVSFAAVYCGGGRIQCTPLSVAEAEGQLAETVEFWKHVELPFDRVVVPDKQIQALIDSSIRNIWQAREIKNGLPAFQVGATCYRALFIVDGAFILEAANMLGAGQQTRAGVAYTLTFQQPDGRFEILPHYHKENGIVLWTCVRHAMLAQDKPWLESIWPKLEKTVDYIKRLRAESYQDASPLNDGLMPPGFPDGGIGWTNHYEYTNVYWNLAGLKAIIQAARWLGKDDQAEQWQQEYDDFYATFRQRAKRDTRPDIHGNFYLPILMTIEDRVLSKDWEWYYPCKAQWAFCHGVYPGQLFEQDDPLVKGNLAMLATYEKEGMVTTTGWLTGGIWNYFASFYGHALLWQGNGRKAAESLYAMANHASPLLAWIEEQGLKGDPIRENGDMPHNWASAEFIRLAVHLLALDRGRQMHLFEGLPKEWTRPGVVTELRGIATPFGPLSCSLRVNDDGSSAALRVEPLADPSCEKIVVHLGHWATSDPAATRSLDPRKSHQITIPIEREGRVKDR